MKMSKHWQPPAPFDWHTWPGKRHGPPQTGAEREHGTGVGVTVGVLVPVKGGPGVTVTVLVAVAVPVTVGVSVGVFVPVAVDVAVPVLIGVFVGVAGTS